MPLNIKKSPLVFAFAAVFICSLGCLTLLKADYTVYQNTFLSPNFISTLFLPKLLLLLLLTFVFNLIPGALFYLGIRPKKESIHITEFILTSFILNTIALSIVTGLDKIIFHSYINTERFSLLLSITAAIGVILNLKRLRPKRISIHASKYEVTLMAAGFAVMLLMFSFFKNEAFLTHSVDFDYSPETVKNIPAGAQSDELEMFGLANSLKQHALPRWLIEYGNTFGTNLSTVPPVSIYLEFFIITLLGESNIATAMLSIFAVFLMLMLSAGILNPLKNQTVKSYYFLPLISLAGYLWLYLSNPCRLSTPQLVLFDLFYFLALYALARQKTSLILPFFMFLSLTRYAGILLSLLAAAFCIFTYKDKEYHKKILKITAGYAAIMAVYFTAVISIAQYEGNLQCIIQSILAENFYRFYDYAKICLLFFKDNKDILEWDKFNSFLMNIQFLKTLFYGTLFLCIFNLYPLKRKLARFVRLNCITYIILIICSKFKAVYYSSLIMFPTGIVAAYAFEGISRKKTSLIIYIFFSCRDSIDIDLRAGKYKNMAGADRYPQTPLNNAEKQTCLHIYSL